MKYLKYYTVSPHFKTRRLSESGIFFRPEDCRYEKPTPAFVDAYCRNPTDRSGLAGAADIGDAERRAPQAAKDTGLGGRVTVQVTVDIAGNVVSVGNVTGPDSVCSTVTRPDVIALRESARSAAANAKFAAGTGDVPAPISLNFDFPTGRSEQAYSADNVPPPDYVGPVSTSSAGTVVKGDALPTNRSGTPSSINGGVLNGKAMSLPMPGYPPAARAVRASGAVNIQVLIDEEGQVFSAAPVSGHPLLRMAARQAACGAAFSPTTLSGQPVKVSGVITYNFVP